MKTIKLLGLLLASVIVGLGFSGCKEDAYESRIKELILNDLSFSYHANSDTLTFRHEDLSHYAIKSSGTWCQAKIMKESSQIGIYVDDNETYDQRMAILTLTDMVDTTKTRTFNVIQAQLDALLIEDEFTHFTGIPTDGRQVTIPVKSNVPYSVVIDENSQDWISQVLAAEAKTRALKDSTIVLDIAKNESRAERTGYAYIVSEDTDMKVKITISQVFEAKLDVNPLTLTLDELGGIVKLTVKSNIDYDVYSQTDWISKSSTKEENDTTTIESFKVEPFTESKKGRTGYIIIENAGWDDLQKKIKVIQNRALYIEKSEVSVNVGGTAKIELVNNTGDDNVTWESSNSRVATVTSDGTAEGVSEGSATLTVTSSDSEHTYSVKVVVKKAAEEETKDESANK